MRLNVFTDYCLRTLLYLGVSDNALATRAEIAAAYDISDAHLMKVVHWLAQRGYIETVRGKGGGMWLARDPASVCIGELVRAAEENSALVECFAGESSRCRIEPACRLKFVLNESMEAMYGVLDTYTLADLLVDPQPLAALLIGAPADRITR
jgi:Rrf2 family nitric oxide-sensitive transcriptional repressor